jgi:signal transduction histidine kinase
MHPRRLPPPSPQPLPSPRPLALPAARSAPIDIARRRLRAERFDSISSLASGMVHSLCHVFAPILASTTMLRQHGVDIECRRHLDAIVSSVGSGTDLLESLLVLSGEDYNGRAACQVADILHSVCAHHRRELAPGLELETDVPPNLWTATANAPQLRRAFAELLVRPAAPPCGGRRVLLSARNLAVTPRTPAARIPVSPGPFIQVMIEHFPTVLSPRALGRLFDPFTAGVDCDVGQGFGLSLPYGIIRNHGGMIDANLIPGRTLRLLVWLPAQAGIPVQTPTTRL